MDLPELLAYATAALERHGIEYAIVGSFASAAWGEPRLTLDVDIVVRLHAEHLPLLLPEFSADEFYVSLPAAEEAVRLRRPFNVIHFSSGGKIDFMVVGNEAWAQAQIDRRRRLQVLPQANVYVASPEDVIIGKLVYFQEGGSEKHLRDIAGILMRAGEAVDRNYVATWAQRLSVIDVWQQVLARIAEDD